MDDVHATYDAVARDAVLNGDGAMVERVPSLCNGCGGWFAALWFVSRNTWICTYCQTAVPGPPPSPEIRQAGKPSEHLVKRLLDEFNKGLPRY
jgi:hypothetical protein